MTSSVLTKAELVAFTDKKRKQLQIAQLIAWDVPYRLTIDGEIKVLWSDIAKSADKTGQQPNLGGVA